MAKNIELLKAEVTIRQKDAASTQFLRSILLKANNFCFEHINISYKLILEYLLLHTTITSKNLLRKQLHSFTVTTIIPYYLTASKVTRLDQFLPSLWHGKE